MRSGVGVCVDGGDLRGKTSVRFQKVKALRGYPLDRGSVPIARKYS